MKSHFTISLFYVSCILISIACSPSKPDIFKSPEWIDLTHTFDSTTPYWPTADGFQLDTVFEGITDKGYYYSAFSFRSAEHGGTHIDAPVHFAEGKESVDEIPLENLTGYGVMIDVKKSVEKNKDYEIEINDLKKWETLHGEIPNGAIVLLHTGFDQYWPDNEKYLGTAMKGDAAVAQLHFPGLDPDAAQWLINDRSIKSIGIDTPSIDYGQSTEFMSHRILFKNNIPAFENLTNLNQLSPVGDFIIALPMKIKGGSGGPLRIVAMQNSL